MKIIKGYGQYETFLQKNTLLSKIMQKLHLMDGIYREIQTTCLVNTLSVGRQLQKFPSRSNVVFFLTKWTLQFNFELDSN